MIDKTVQGGESRNQFFVAGRQRGKVIAVGAPNITDLSIIIVFHHEGALAYRTLRSIYRSRLYAEDRGLTVELVAVLNAADPETTAMVQRWQERFRIDQLFETTFATVGPARNEAVRQATGTHIAICDGDDLYCERWFHEGYKTAVADPTHIAHPQYVVAFGAQSYWIQYFDQRDSRIDSNQLLAVNLWASSIIASRILFHTISYPAFTPDEGLGPEDWFMTAEAVAHGHTFVIARKTVRFYRRKATDSLDRDFSETRALIPPTPMFEIPAFKLHNLHGLMEVTGGDTGPRTLVQRAVIFLQRLLVRPLYGHLPVRQRTALTRFTIRTKQRLQLPLRSEERDLVMLPITTTGFASQLPAWIQPESHTLAQIDRSVYVPDEQRRQLQKVEPEKVRDPLTELHSYLLQRWPATVPSSHVFIMPGMGLSGSDRTALNYLRELVQQYRAHVTVIFTGEGPIEPRRLRQLPPGIFIVSLVEMFDRYERSVQKRALARILLQRQPKHVMVCNSPVGWQLYERYARALAHFSALYALDFSQWKDEQGMRVGYGSGVMATAARYITRIFTDNQTMNEAIVRTTGCDPQKIHTIYNPSSIQTVAATSAFDPASHRVLWVGRFDREKRIDLLVKIARTLPDFDFYIYGKEVLNRDQAIVSELRRLPNVHCHPPFTDINEVFGRPYSCYLHTSSIEGLPNVLHEVARFHLPIVATDVGGVHEFITAETGYLIPESDSPEGFVDAIRAISSDPATARRRAKKALERATTRHSLAHFQAALQLETDFVT